MSLILYKLHISSVYYRLIVRPNGPSVSDHKSKFNLRYWSGVSYFGLEKLPFLIIAAFVEGGMSNPLYSLLIVHTNDFVDLGNMILASSGRIFILGLGAISIPLIVGWVLSQFRPKDLSLIILALQRF